MQPVRLLRRLVWIAALVLVAAFATKSRAYLPESWSGSAAKTATLGAAVLAVVGLWKLLTKVVVVEFLNSTELELRKVSWPSYGQVKVGSQLVLITVVVMSCTIFGLDQFWRLVFTAIGFLEITK